MKSIAGLKKKVLGKISPSAEEADEEKRFASRLKKTLEGAGAEKVSFVGSAARDTGLRGDNDIDLFIQYPATLEKDYIVEKTFAYVRKNIKADWIVRYAEHPYLQTKIGGFKVEVIPCFTAKPHESIKSAVDRSPLHMDYLQKRLSSKQREDVRLLKQLLKNNGLYGAEIAVRGFSGLVCEYLTLNYRSFEGVVENAAKWHTPVRIDIEGTSEKKFGEALAIIDAIDRNRNAAAVTSEENVLRVIALCQAFASNPSEKFFFSRPKNKTIAESKAAWKKRSTQIALVEFPAPDAVEDILSPQLDKTRSRAEKQLALDGFCALGAHSFTEKGKCFMLFEFAFAEKPRVKKILGPPAWDAKAVAKFLKGKKVLRGPFIEGNRIAIEIEGERKNAFQKLAELKTRAVKWGAASRLLAPLKKAVVRRNEGVFTANAAHGLQDYFFKREQWW